MTQRFLDLSLLRPADAVEAHRCLLAAFAVFGVRQPALSNSPRELEEIMELYDRPWCGVWPAEAGQVR